MYVILDLIIEFLHVESCIVFYFVVVVYCMFVMCTQSVYSCTVDLYTICMFYY
jgi:hypothetical protein